MRRVLLSPQTIIGIAVFGFGAFVAVLWQIRPGWFMEIPGLVSMGLNSPLMLAVAGLALVARSVQSPRADRLADLAGWLLIVYPSLLLAQTIFGVDLGLDFMRVPTPATPAIPHPGRPAPNTCVAVMAAGITVLALRRPTLRAWQHAATAALTVLMLIVGLGLVGHLLGLQQLYQLASYNMMLLPTAIALLLLAGGLRLLRDASRTEVLDPRELERRIGHRVLIKLTLVAVGSGMVGLAVLKETFETAVMNEARQSAHTHAIALSNALRTSLWFAKAMAAQPTVKQSFARLAEDRRDPATLGLLPKIAAGFLTMGLEGVRFLGGDGRVLEQAGQFTGDDATATDELRVPGLRAQLRWRNGYFLRTEAAIEQEGARLGTVVTEQRMVLIDEVLRALRQGDGSSDAVVCSQRQAVAVCAPTKLYTQPSTIPLYDTSGKPALPISHALFGEAGASFARDLRGIPVVAGFTPIGDFGLGLVVKTDVSSLYAPLRERFLLVAFLISAMVAAGTWALRAHVRPLLQAVIAEQQRTRTILDTSSDAFIGLDVHGHVHDWNLEACRLFGRTQAEAVGRLMAELIIPPQHRAAHARGFAHFIHSGAGPVVGRRTDITGLHRDGHEIPVELSVSAVSTPRGFVTNAFVRDIRERQAAQQLIAASEQRLRAITDNLPVLISYIDAEHRLQFVNRTFEEWTRIPIASAVGKPVRQVFGERLYAQIEEQIKRALRGEFVQFEVESTVLGVNRCLHTTYIPDMENAERALGLYALTSDVTILRDAERKMAELALNDALTGLPNRRRFDERLPEALARAKRSGLGSALFFIDVDYFKAVNDTHGHAAGDAVLVDFAHRLRSCVRDTDFAARVGGDEFIVVLEGMHSAADCELVAGKIVLAVREATVFQSTTLHVSASIGAAYLPGGAQATPEALLKVADDALYQSKQNGRNTYRCRQIESSAL